MNPKSFFIPLSDESSDSTVLAVKNALNSIAERPNFRKAVLALEYGKTEDFEKEWSRLNDADKQNVAIRLCDKLTEALEALQEAAEAMDDCPHCRVPAEAQVVLKWL